MYRWNDDKNKHYSNQQTIQQLSELHFYQEVVSRLSIKQLA